MSCQGDAKRKQADLARERNRREDFQLAAKAVEGESSAFERLTLKYENRIYRHCFKILNNEEDALDATQETFFQLFKSIRTFRGDSAFSTWLFKIATNFCLMRIRKRRRIDFVSIDEPIEIGSGYLKREITDWSENPELKHDGVELLEELDRLIARLSEEKRIILILKEIEGFSNGEISAITGQSIAAVKSNLHRARLFVRAELAKRFAGSLPIAARHDKIQGDEETTTAGNKK